MTNVQASAGEREQSKHRRDRTKTKGLRREGPRPANLFELFKKVTSTLATRHKDSAKKTNRRDQQKARVPRAKAPLGLELFLDNHTEMLMSPKSLLRAAREKEMEKQRQERQTIGWALGRV